MLDISAFDPPTASAVAWAEYHEFRRARAEEDEPGEPIPSDADTEHDLRQHWPLFANQRFFAHRAGRLIGLLGVGWRRPESEGAEAHAPFIHAWGGVLAAERRQGVGTALLMPLAGLMRAQGKTTLTCSTTRPDGNAFLAAIGATLKHRSAENRLAFAGLDWGMLAAWNQVPADLTWEIHAGRAPFPRLRALVAPFNRLLADIPLGDLDLPPPRYELVGWKTWYGGG